MDNQRFLLVFFGKGKNDFLSFFIDRPEWWSFGVVVILSGDHLEWWSFRVVTTQKGRHAAYLWLCTDPCTLGVGPGVVDGVVDLS